MEKLWRFKIYIFSNVKSIFGCFPPILTSNPWEKNVVYDTLEKILQFMTPYMIDVIVILHIVWLKVVNCNRQVIKDKKSLNVQHDNFHPIINHYGQVIYNVEVSYNQWLE